MPGSGRRIRPKLKYTGRGLGAGRSTEVMDWRTQRVPGWTRVENYTGNRLVPATRRVRRLAQVIEVMMILRRAQAPSPFHGLVAGGVSHTIDGEQRRSSRD